MTSVTEINLIEYFGKIITERSAKFSQFLCKYLQLFYYYFLQITPSVEKMSEIIKNPDLLEMIFRYLNPASAKTASLVSRSVNVMMSTFRKKYNQFNLMFNKELSFLDFGTP